jgi:hypothetical protein
MNPNYLHEPRTPVERRAQRQLWITTLVIVTVLLLTAIAFFILR